MDPVTSALYRIAGIIDRVTAVIVVATLAYLTYELIAWGVPALWGWWTR